MRTRRKPVVHKSNVERSTGNVYADLEVRDSEEMLVKAELVRQISEILKGRRLTQEAAAKLLRLTQTKISRMLRGDFRGISEQRLLRCLTRLGRDVQIIIKRTPKKGGLGRGDRGCGMTTKGAALRTFFWSVYSRNEGHPRIAGHPFGSICVCGFRCEKIR